MFRNYLAIIRAEFYRGLNYKIDNLLSIVNRIIEVSVLIFIWKAIYENQTTIQGMDLTTLILYYALAYSLGHIVQWGIDENMGFNITTGRVNMELLYPISYMKYYFCYKIGHVLRQLFVIVLPTLLVLILLFQIPLSFEISRIFLFLIIMIFTIIISFFIEFIFGLIVFYTTSSWGLQILKSALITILSGALAPLEFFPIWAQKIMNLLPFQDLVYSPIMTLLGMNSNHEIITILLRQSVWMILLFVITKLLFNKAIKKVTIYGG